jgi:hypothetical protein
MTVPSGIRYREVASLPSPGFALGQVACQSEQGAGAYAG